MNVHTQFNGKVCLITGAGSDEGIGFAAAKIIGGSAANLPLPQRLREFMNVKRN